MDIYWFSSVYTCLEPFLSDGGLQVKLKLPKILLLLAVVYPQVWQPALYLPPGLARKPF
jgi:hypothetical protein